MWCMTTCSAHPIRGELLSSRPTTSQHVKRPECNLRSVTLHGLLYFLTCHRLLALITIMMMDIQHNVNLPLAAPLAAASSSSAYQSLPPLRCLSDDSISWLRRVIVTTSVVVRIRTRTPSSNMFLHIPFVSFIDSILLRHIGAPRQITHTPRSALDARGGRLCTPFRTDRFVAGMGSPSSRSSASLVIVASRIGIRPFLDFGHFPILE